MTRRVRTRELVTAIAAIILVFWAGPLLVMATAAGFAGRGDQFNLVHWELTRLTGRIVNRATGTVLKRSATDAEVARYFEFLRKARRESRSALTASDGAGMDADTRAAAATAAGALRPLVETRFEQAVAGAARRAGLTDTVPLFDRINLVWPPPVTGFTVPPRILIISPRDRVALNDTSLLRGDLSEARRALLEARAERAVNTSALVDQVGGLSAYPSIADQDTTPLYLLQTVAHEWMHAHLLFHPLGARYGQTNAMTLINETVANLVGRELGSLAFDDLHLPLPVPAPSAGAGPTAGLNFDKTMHDLRLEVDALLKQGSVAEAEQRMNDTQALLARNGYSIRRINQAYFAFYGSYGDSPAASSPLGGEIASLRRLSPSLAVFVRRVQTISAPSDLDRLLRER